MKDGTQKTKPSRLFALSLTHSPPVLLLLLLLLLHRRVGASVSAFTAVAPGRALHVEEEGKAECSWKTKKGK